MPDFLVRDNIATIITDTQTAADAAMTGTLAAVHAERRNFLAGFCLTGAGATGASIIEVATTGLTTNLKFKVVIPAGATVALSPLLVTFNPALPASADNTAITVTVPSFGAGNTAAALSTWGYAE